MISKTQKQQIKQVLGHRYSELVLAELNKTGQLTRNNTPYSSKHIVNVMNGEANKIIEAAITSAVDTKTKENNKLDQLLKTQ